MGWIQRVMEAHSENEAPRIFFYWAAISSISAVMRKNVFLDRHFYKLWPNTNVFLVAASGMKKGIPVTMAKSLVSKVNCTRVISGRNSMQAIIKDLGKACSLENGDVLRDAHGFLVSGELAAFLVKDPDALTILTDLHDTHAYEKEWINTLKVAGVDKLHSPCISVLGATNEEHFPDAVPANAIGGGFIARTFVVYSNEPGQLNSLTNAPTQQANLDDLSKYLVELSKLKGEFKWTDESKKVYDDWYYPFMNEKKHDPTGTLKRIGDQALKVAMCVSLSEDSKMILTSEYINEGINAALSCVQGMKQVTLGAGKSSMAHATRIVFRELLLAPGNQVERSILLSKYWGEFDAFDIDRIAETLEGAGAIDIHHQGKKTVYCLKKGVLGQYQDIKKGIQ